LSEQFLSTASQQALKEVILQKIRHFVDAKVNNTDTVGIQVMGDLCHL
jgi:hypothetical protein